MSSKKLTRDEAVDRLKAMLINYWNDKSSPYFDIIGRRPIWLRCPVGSIFVRDSHHRIVDQMCDTFDFANFHTKEKYQNLGIMLEVIEWWHTQHDRHATFIECVHNPALAKKLAAQGWIKEPSALDVHYYKLTGHK